LGKEDWCGLFVVILSFEAVYSRYKKQTNLFKEKGACKQGNGLLEYWNGGMKNYKSLL